MLTISRDQIEALKQQIAALKIVYPGGSENPDGIEHTPQWSDEVLERAVWSALNQLYLPWQVIVPEDYGYPGVHFDVTAKGKNIITNSILRGAKIGGTAE